MIERFTRIPQPTPPTQLEDLTERELDVFRLIARGLSNAEIGKELFISDTTVKTHITHILSKLDLRDRVQAVVLAYQAGLFEGDAAPGASDDQTASLRTLPGHADFESRFAVELVGSEAASATCSRIACSTSTSSSTPQIA